MPDFAIDSVASSGGVTIAGGVTIGELGRYASETDSYTIALNTDPGGTVELSVSADSQSEVSVDGSPFASSVNFTSNDTSPTTVTVRAKDDSVGEGPHTSTITHAIVSGTVGYPAETLINNMVADVVDDEQPPLVGVDMYYTGGNIGSVPPNWNEFDAANPAMLLDLMRDDGVATPFDLEIKFTNISSIGGASVTAIPETVPVHTPSLEGLDDNARWRNSSSNPQPFANVEAIWSGLDPGEKYGIYVFAMESSTNDTINQRVTISGSGVDDPAPFTQVSAGKDDILIVNDEDGDSSRWLDTYAKVVTADAGGAIHVNVRRDDGVIRNRIYLAGLAIQELNDPPPPMPTLNFTTASQSGAEDIGTMTITASLSEPAGSDVTVPFTVGGAAMEGAGGDFTITSSPITISAGMTSADITITVNDDDEFEPSESIVVTMGAPTGAELGTTIAHTATITDNDIAPVDLDFGDAPTASQSGFAADYPTTLPSGARHTISALVLGSTVDSEGDGQPTAAADGDAADEDGVQFVTSVVTTATAATIASVLVTASAPGKLDAWIDFTRDGDWTDAGEQLFASSIDLVTGPNIVSFVVPSGSSAGETYARFRLSSSGGLSPEGAAADGEVEDYRLTILDGSSPVAAEVDMRVGEVDVIADGSDVVYRRDSVELFRAPGSTLANTTFLGTDGDDVLHLGNLSSALASPIPLIYDGGAGRDSVVLIDSGQSLDLTNLTLTQLSNIEVIEIIGASANSLTLNGAGVAAATDGSNELLVIHDQDDTVSYVGAGWDVIAPIWVDGSQRHVLSSGAIRVETINTRPYHNPLLRTDVNSVDGTSVLDALNIINFLGRVGTNPFLLPTPNSPDELAERYYDANGDGSASSLDALNVINFLAQQSPSESEQLTVAARLASPVRLVAVAETRSAGSEIDPVTTRPAFDQMDLGRLLSDSGARPEPGKSAEVSPNSDDQPSTREDTEDVWDLALDQVARATRVLASSFAELRAT